MVTIILYREHGMFVRPALKPFQDRVGIIQQTGCFTTTLYLASAYELSRALKCVNRVGRSCPLCSEEKQCDYQLRKHKYRASTGKGQYDFWVGADRPGSSIEIQGW
jgi:hypothetical protein